MSKIIGNIDEGVTGLGHVQDRVVAVVDRLTHQGVTWMRVREVADTQTVLGAWQAIAGGVGLALVQRGEATVLLIDSGASAVEVVLDAEAATGLLVLGRSD